jgi:hypothetical protein
MDVTVVQCVDGIDVSSYDVLISHDFVDRRGIDENATRVYGGRAMTRPEEMGVIAASGVPVMPWALADNAAEVLDLFEHWRAERLLLKRSGSFKGDGVAIFDRHHIDAFAWNLEHDLFCPELNEADGDVYKIEIFNGHIILGWVSRSPPLAAGFREFATGIKGAYGQRHLVAYSRALRTAALALSRTLTERGIGYASLDLMKRTTGELLAIEINTAQVATWWTAKFPWVRWRYASAVLELIQAAR